MTTDRGAAGAAAVERKIRAAFADAAFPGDERLWGSDEGVEPFLLEEAFRGRDDWRAMELGFLDQAPDGYSSALAFFSHEVFRFYLPAYLVADLDGALLRADPLFYLCHGVDESSKDEAVNPRRFGDYTWNDYARERFAGFTRAQAEAIVAYLELKLADAATDLERAWIETALDNFWRERAGAG